MKALVLFLAAFSMAVAPRAADPSAAPSPEWRPVVQYGGPRYLSPWSAIQEVFQSRTAIRAGGDPKRGAYLLNALRFEKASPRADVIYVSANFAAAAAKEGLLEDYRPPGWEKVPPGLKDGAGAWWTVNVAHVAFVVNPAALRGKPVPRSYAALLSPVYRGLVAYDDPAFSEAGFAFVDGIDRALGGSPGREKGWRYLRELNANLAGVGRSDLFPVLERGEIAIWIETDALRARAEKDEITPLIVVAPSEGAIVVPYAMALVKNARHPEDAKRYLDFLLSGEAQTLFARGGETPVVPTRETPPPKAPPVLPEIDGSAERARQVIERWRREVKADGF